jgi:hypothetical protein
MHVSIILLKQNIGFFSKHDRYREATEMVFTITAAISRSREQIRKQSLEEYLNIFSHLRKRDDCEINYFQYQLLQEKMQFLGDFVSVYQKVEVE